MNEVGSPYTMMLQPACSLSLMYSRTFVFALILARVCIVESFIFCSRDIFGFPKYSDCMLALRAVPTDNVIQYFVEQQLRTGLPEANWATFVDPRPSGSKREVVQVPKLWNRRRSS